MVEIVCRTCGAVYIGDKNPDKCLCKSEDFEFIEKEEITGETGHDKNMQEI